MEDSEPKRKVPKLEPVAVEVVKQNRVKLENVKEEILTEDEDNIVGIISQFDETKDALEEDFDNPGYPTIEVKVKIEEPNQVINTNNGGARTMKKPKKEEPEINIENAFTDLEDMALHALDLISPYDINFASSHMAKRSPRDIERRLDDYVFRKKYFLFQKIPSFLFGITFTNNKLLKFRSLMLVSEKQVANLICINKNCVHGTDIEELTLEYEGKSKLGVDLNIIVEFINTHCPPRFKSQLFMTADRLDFLFTESKLSFHRYGTSIGHVYTKMKKAKGALQIKQKDSPMLLQDGNLILSTEHKTTLVKIVSAVGKSRWDAVLVLMEEIFGKTKPTKASKAKVAKMLSEVYLESVDPDLEKGPFTEEEDKCLLFLHKHFYQSCLGNVAQMWKAIARHMAGRSEEECRERLRRKSTSKNDLTLDNLDLEDIQEDVPSLFYYNESHIFALTIIPKSENQDLDIPTKLQLESRFLIAGTLDEIFILPCKESALRCAHHGMSTMNFTYNPAKPDSQFEAYLKLTFANQLKRTGLLDEDLAKSFAFSQINYAGKGIHQIIDNINATRFVVPRDHFMTLNQKEDEVTTGGKRGFANDKIYRIEEEETS